MKILHFDKVDSTQAIASSLADNLIEDTLVLADIQTSGRGRLHERTWVSVKGNFHGSFVINLEKIGISKDSITMLSDISLNIIKGFLLSETNSVPQIKYPNDVLIDSLKVAGVLIDVNFPVAIIGIGLNTSIAPIQTSAKISVDNEMFANYFYKKLYEDSSTY